MAVDLIVSEHGHVMIAQHEAMAAEPARVDFDVQTRQLTVSYDGQAQDDIFDVRVHDRMFNAMVKAASILLVQVENNVPVAGYDVPLVRVGI